MSRIFILIRLCWLVSASSLLFVEQGLMLILIIPT